MTAKFGLDSGTGSPTIFPTAKYDEQFRRYRKPSPYAGLYRQQPTYYPYYSAWSLWLWPGIKWAWKRTGGWVEEEVLRFRLGPLSGRSMTFVQDFWPGHPAGNCTECGSFGHLYSSEQYSDYCPTCVLDFARKERG